MGPARPPTPNIVQNLGCSCGFGAARAKPWWPFQRAEKYVFVKPAGSTPTNIQGPCLGLRGVCISALTVPPLLFTAPLLSHPRGDSSPHLLRQHLGPIFHHLMIRAVPLSRALHQVLFFFYVFLIRARGGPGAPVRSLWAFRKSFGPVVKPLKGRRRVDKKGRQR